MGFGFGFGWFVLVGSWLAGLLVSLVDYIGWLCCVSCVCWSILVWVKFRLLAGFVYDRMLLVGQSLFSG